MNLPLLFGERSNAIFDLWSLQHGMSGVILGTILLVLTPSLKTRQVSFFIFVVCIAVSWEALELAMELGWFGNSIAVWKGGFEHWANRLIGDPLMAIAGSYLALKFPKVWKPLLVPLALWALVNFAAPNSMYIQRFML